MSAPPAQQLKRHSSLDTSKFRHRRMKIRLCRSEIGSFDVESGTILLVFPQFIVHLENYSARHLTCSYDSLNAFPGVMDHFQKVSTSKICLLEFACRT